MLHEHYKYESIDLSNLLTPAATLRPDAAQRCVRAQDHGLDTSLDQTLMKEAAGVLAAEPGTTPEAITIEAEINNEHRATGTLLSYEISKRFGEAGLPADTIKCNLRGHAGQSLGAWLASGVTIDLEGDANDYVGKGLSGGDISVRPPADAPFKAAEQVIIGNVALYGAIAGELFVSGKAAERFCVRNSGARAVVEGCGDHGCEYMTGGVAVILGTVGKNFGAGMSGGLAFVYDADGTFASLCNSDVKGDLTPLSDDADVAEVRELVEKHAARTQSVVAAELLADWDAAVGKFVKVFPHEYARALRQMEAEKQQEDLLAAHDGSDAMAALKASLSKAHDYQQYSPPPAVGKDVDWALLLKDASDGWMVNGREATWEAGRETVAEGHTDKARGFMTYERLSLPLRDVTKRTEDYGEVLDKLNDDQRDHLLNTQACPRSVCCLAVIVCGSSSRDACASLRCDGGGLACCDARARACRRRAA